MNLSLFASLQKIQKKEDVDNKKNGTEEKTELNTKDLISEIEKKEEITIKSSKTKEKKPITKKKKKKNCDSITIK